MSSTLSFHKGYLKQNVDSKCAVKLILKLTEQSFDDLHDVAKKYLNQIVNAKWPFCTEAKIIEVIDSNQKYYWKDGEIKSAPIKEDIFNSYVKYLQER